MDSKQDIIIDVDTKANIELERNIDDKAHNVDWRNICMRYLWLIFCSAFVFGLQTDGKYYKITLSVGFIHFASELEPVYYLLFSAKNARKITFVSYFIHTLEAIVIWFTGYLFHDIFALQFIFSDTMNFVVSMMYIFHPKTDKKLFKMCLAFSLHYIGVFWAESIVILKRFYDETIPIGFGWITIAICGLIQLYLLKDYLIKNNHIDIVIPNIPKKTKCLYILCAVCAIIIYVGLGFFRTTKFPGHDKEKWGDSFEIMTMRIVGPLSGFIGVYGSCYYYRFIHYFD